MVVVVVVNCDTAVPLDGGKGLRDTRYVSFPLVISSIQSFSSKTQSSARSPGL